ncbi:MAG: bifunctional 4-hydroxy-2-oxoglutarate aldolase/2-dehydro-3-deoxy-phosphogluconate aldolase [Candidatus Dormibacteria bacterium]
MDGREDAFREMCADRAVAVLRSGGIALPADYARALVDVGIHCVELTFTDSAVLEGIAAAAEVPGVVVGAGTVPDAAAARSAIDAGARFLVTPGLNPGVANVARQRGVPFLEGAFTPTEVAAALDHGAAAVKIFPASTAGPGHIRALLGPFGGAALIPSGGIGPANAGEYLAAGATAVSASVATAAALKAGDVEAVRDGGAALAAAIRSWVEGGVGGGAR